MYRYVHMNIAGATFVLAGAGSAGASKRLIRLTIGHIRGIMSQKNKCAIGDPRKQPLVGELGFK